MTILPTPKKLQHGTHSHRHAPKMEKAIAKRLGGKVVKGSGCGTEKGDARCKNIMRIEAKCTSRKSFSLTREIVDKIENAAMAGGELPAIVVQFLDPVGQPTHELAIMPTWALELVVDTRRANHVNYL